MKAVVDSAHDLPHDWPATTAAWDRLGRCHSCGLATLRLFVESASWVTRRVERIEFLDDRTVRRHVSVSYVTPQTGLVLQRAGTSAVRILPIAAMRRKSLVNFSFRDQDDHPVPLLGLRENQKITIALINAWAAETLSDARGGPAALEQDSPAERVIRDIIEGDQAELNAAWTVFCSTGAHEPDNEAAQRLHASLHTDDLLVLGWLRNDASFRLMLDRLAANFLLFEPCSAPPGTMRVVKFSYDEPLTARYSAAGYSTHEASSCQRGPQYRPQLPRPWWKDPLAGLGVRATLVRFPVPSAELAASFHLEIVTPPGASIVEASLLAGLPNLFGNPDPGKDKDWYRLRYANHTLDARRRRRRPSYDFVGPGHRTVDLHVADVPYGSLSRAQVFLRARPQGWLATNAACAWVVFAALWGTISIRPKDTDIAATVLITLAAAIMTLVVHDDEHRMVTRLLGVLKLVSAASVAVLVLAALVIAAFDAHDALVYVCAFVSFTLAAIVTLSWALSVYSLRDQGGRDVDRRRFGHIAQKLAAPRPEGQETLARELASPRRRPVLWLRTKLRDAMDRQTFLRESPWEQYPLETSEGPAEAEIATARTALQRRFAEHLDMANYPYDEAVHHLRFDLPAIRVASAEGSRTSFDWNYETRRSFMDRLRSATPTPPLAECRTREG